MGDQKGDPGEEGGEGMSDPVLTIKMHQTELNRLHDFLTDHAVAIQNELDTWEPYSSEPERDAEAKAETQADLDELNELRAMLARQDPEC